MLAKNAPLLPVMPILESGEWRGRPFFVLPFLQGMSLDRVLVEERALLPSSAIMVLRSTLEYLELLHGAGFVHGDLSPDNVFLETEAPIPDDGSLPEDITVRLVDFNSARRIDGPENRPGPAPRIPNQGGVNFGT